MRTFLEQYYTKHFLGKKDTLTLVECYQIYCGIERYYGRTPINYYKYRTAFYFYFNYVYKFMVRIKWVFHVMYRIGTLKMGRTSFKLGTYKIVWRKERGKQRFQNQEIYMFQPPKGNTNYGHKSVLSWVKETNHNPNVGWLDIIDD